MASTANRRTLLAVATAMLIVAGLNVWIGIRLPWLLQYAELYVVPDLTRRIERFDARDQVEVVVLGNSHAIAAFRPRVVAETLGLSEGQVFSLALPSASAEEARLLAEHFLPHFPKARVALLNVDAFLLTANQELRHRYLTRHALYERWRYAQRYASWEDRLGILLSWFFPLIDFKTELFVAFRAHPHEMLRCLWRDEVLEEGALARSQRMEYPWGYPPPWDFLDPAELERQRVASQQASYIEQRAALLMGGDARAMRHGIRQIEALAATLERRGMRLVLTELPYSPELTQRIEQHHSPQQQAYREVLNTHMVQAGLQVKAAAREWKRADFHDTDHLNYQASARFLQVLRQAAPELTRRGASAASRPAR